MKKILGKLSRLSMKKLVVLMVVTFGLMSSTGWAIWVLATSSTFLAQIQGFEDEPVGYSIAFSSAIMNLTDGAVAQNFTGEIRNDEGNINMTFTADIVKEDADDLCTDYTNDCTLAYYFDGIGINDNDIVEVEGSSLTPVVAEISCAEFSCPQNITVTLSFNATA